MISEVWLKISRTAGARIYGVVLGMVTLFVTARWLGPEGRGEIAAVMSWMTMASTIMGLSLGQVSLYTAAQSQGLTWRRDTLSLLVPLTGMFSVIGWLILALCYWLSEGDLFGGLPVSLLALGMLFIPFAIWEQYSGALLQASDRLDVYNKLQVISRTCAASLVVVFVVVLNFEVSSVLLGNLIGLVVLAGASLHFLIEGERGLGQFSIAPAWRLIKSGAKLHLNTVGAFLISSADIIMLNYYRGSEETGWYQLGFQLTMLMLLVPQAAAMVVNTKIATQGPIAAWLEHRRLLFQTIVVMAIAAVIATVTASWWLLAIAGDAFLPTVSVFQWQMLALLGMTFSVLMAPQWIARGYFWQASALTLTIGFGNVAANMVLIPTYGMYGAVWATIGVYVIGLVGNVGMMLLCNKSSNVSQVRSAQ